MSCYLLFNEGDYDFSDLVSFVRLVTFDDLRAAGLKVSGARKLEACMNPESRRRTPVASTYHNTKSPITVHDIIQILLLDQEGEDLV
jgi:hypothetical protein